jgi:hypothetical protein
LADAAGSATASVQPRISAVRNALTMSRWLSIVSCITANDSEDSGSPLSAKASVTGVEPAALTMNGSLVRNAMNPSTFFSVNGVGSY